MPFSHTTTLLPCNIKFSMDGQYPSRFQNCRIGGLNAYNRTVSCAVYSPDGNKILLGLDNNSVMLWDLYDEKPVWNFYLYSYLGESHVKYTAFSPDGKYLTFLLADTAMLLDAVGNVIFKYTKPGYPAEGLVLFSPDSHLWFAHLNHCFILINLTDHQQICMDSPEQYCNCLVSADFSSSQLLIADYNGTVTIWNSNGNLTHKRTFDDVIIQAAFLPDDTVCVICTERNILYWNTTSDKIMILHKHFEDILTLNAVFSPDRQFLTVNCSDGSFRLIHIQNSHTAILSHHSIDQVLFSPDNRYLLFTATDIQKLQLYAREAVLYDLESQTSVSVQFSDLSSEVTAAFSPTSQCFILCSGGTDSMSLKFVQYLISGESKELNIDTLYNHFKGCDFNGAVFLSSLDKKLLHKMGAIVDSDDEMPKFIADCLNIENLF